MKKVLIGLAFAVSVTAHAQTTTTNLPAAAASATPAAAGPTPTLSTSIAEQENSLMKKIAVSTYFDFMADSAPVNDAGTRKDNDVASENYLQVGYKLDADTKISLRHNFGWTVSGEHNGKYTLIDPSIIYSTKGPKLGNFEPMAMAYSLYIPVSDSSREAHRLGILRADISADYNITTKLVGNLFTSPRFYINTAQNEFNADGSDSRLRFIGGASATYNFSDRLNAYYAPYVDVASTDINRGKFSATGKDKTASSAAGMSGQAWNHFIHEVGMGVNVTKTFSLTPAVINYVSMNTGEGFGREEAMEYDLYVSASF